MQIKDGAIGKGTIKVDKYWAGEDKPYETLEAGNIWLNTGWDEILKLIIGTSANHFNGTYTTCGIGDDATAAAVTQTDLIASTNKTYVTCDSGYPTESTQAVTFIFTFGTTSANYAWAEVVIKNSASGICWDRSAPSGGSALGTKTSSEIWQLTAVLGRA